MGKKLYLFLFVFYVTACSNSEYLSLAETENTFQKVGDGVVSSIIFEDQSENISSEVDSKSYIPLDDTEYPYAGLPRIVIETESYKKIENVITDVPAKLQIWGEKSPKTPIMMLTIRGRGNSSWNMPKKSYKIEFMDKQSLLGMPANRDWALVSNYADKTLMKNYLMYHFASQLKSYYSPKNEFAELYLNGEYLGVYLVTETIKIGKNRIDIPEGVNSYVVEVDSKLRDGEQFVYSDVIPTVQGRKNFRIHAPKNATEEQLMTIQDYIRSYENFLKDIRFGRDNNLRTWIDVDEYIKHYWIQEFSGNADAAFYASVFFSWVKGGVIRMGPVWDFDLSFGGHLKENLSVSQGWYTKQIYWNRFLFKDSIMSDAAKKFWFNHRDEFKGILTTIDSVALVLHNASENNFKRWNVLNSTSAYHPKSFKSYDEAIKYLQEWILERYDWIDAQYK